MDEIHGTGHHKIGGYESDCPSNPNLMKHIYGIMYQHGSRRGVTIVCLCGYNPMEYGKTASRVNFDIPYRHGTYGKFLCICRTLLIKPSHSMGPEGMIIRQLGHIQISIVCCCVNVGI